MDAEYNTSDMMIDGLNELWDGGEQAKFDVVFVHGLRGHPRKTWEDIDLDDEEERVFWPKDLLPKTIPSSRIFSFGYYTEFATFYPLIKPDLIAHTSIDDNSTSLLVRLGNLRKQTGTQKRPIIFVAHSLGGLVVANGLSGQSSSNEQRQEVINSTCGTIFLGTPFKGADKIVWAKLAEKFLGLFGDSNDQTIKDLDKRSLKLQMITDDFHKLLRRRYTSKELSPIQVACFFETMSTKRTFWRKKKDLGLVVTKESATLAGDDGMAINADHCRMCRFLNPEMTGYIDITNTLKLMMENWSKDKMNNENSGKTVIRLGDLKQGDGILNYGIVSGHVVGTVKDSVSQSVSHQFISSGDGTPAMDAAMKAWAQKQAGK